MSKIKEAFIKAQTISDSEKRIHSLIFKTSIKKSVPYILGIIGTFLIGNQFDINIFILLAISLFLGYLMFKKVREAGTEFNDFKPYQGHIVNIKIKDKSCNLLLKQGKTPVNMEILHSVDEFKKLKKNDFICISYNKTKKVAILHNK